MNPLARISLGSCNPYLSSTFDGKTFSLIRAGDEYGWWDELGRCVVEQPVAEALWSALCFGAKEFKVVHQYAMSASSGGPYTEKLKVKSMWVGVGKARLSELATVAAVNRL